MVKRTSHAKVIAAIDISTLTVQCMLVDVRGRVLSSAKLAHRQHRPYPGWMEHDATDIWNKVTRVVTLALRRGGFSVKEIAAVGVTNQRETIVVWDTITGRPLAPAITWQDTRTTPIVNGLSSGTARSVEDTTGLVPGVYFVAPRLRWLLDNIGGLQAAGERGDAVFGTIESWVIWNLTGGPDGGLHITDVTNASRTLLMDIHHLRWHPKMFREFDIPIEMAPQIVANSGHLGSCTKVLPGVPITAAIGDQQAALFGHACFSAGDAKCTFDSGAFFLVNTGGSIAPKSGTLLPTVGWVLGGHDPVYALEGPIASAGSLIEWLRTSLGLVDHAAEIETLAQQVDSNGGCYIVPAFSGLFAPHWDDQARGTIVGLTEYVTKNHLARAALESTAWQTGDVVAEARRCGITIDGLAVDGAMTANHLAMQILANTLGITISRAYFQEASAVGVAYMAGLAVGYWRSLDEIAAIPRIAGQWHPETTPTRRNREFNEWRAAIARARTESE